VDECKPLPAGRYPTPVAPPHPGYTAACRSRSAWFRGTLNLKAQVESSISHFTRHITFYFQALSSRCFQLEFHRVNLHRLTLAPPWPVFALSASKSFNKPHTRFSASSSAASPQGLTLVHLSAQPEPFLTQHTPYLSPITPYYPQLPPEHPLNNPYKRQPLSHTKRSS